jgi:hypothetical protein
MATLLSFDSKRRLGRSDFAVNPFESPVSRAGLAHSGEIAGHAVLIARLGGNFGDSGVVWELLDVDASDPEAEYNASAWTQTDDALAKFESWAIEWVPIEETRAFAERYFENLNEAVVWGEAKGSDEHPR